MASPRARRVPPRYDQLCPRGDDGPRPAPAWDECRSLDQDIRPVLRIEWIDEDLHATGMASMLAAGRRRLSLVDCVSFAFMSRAGLREVFAFDEHFAERGFSCIPSDASTTTEVSIEDLDIPR